MRIAFAAFYESYPPHSGASSVTYGCAKYAPGERHLLQLGPHPGRTVTPDGVHLRTVAPPARARGERRARWSSVPRLAAAIGDVAPDTVVQEGASWVGYHWRLLRRLRRLPSTPRVIYHAHNLEASLRAQKHGRLVRTATRWAERRLVRGADEVFAVSEQECDAFERLYGRRPRLWPNGVDCARFDRVTTSEVASATERYGLSDRTVLFMGSYLYRPNREAIDALVTSIFPRIVDRMPDARLAVVGGVVPYDPPWLTNLPALPYEELPALVNACAVGVAPIRSGAGTRIKILEYLAAGIPAVATTKGAEGLALVPGEQIVIADDEPSFGTALHAVLTDADLARAVGENGRSAVRRTYDWPRILASCGLG